MKTTTLLAIGGSILLAGAIIHPRSAAAHEGHGTVDISIPASAEGIVQEIQKHHARITTAFSAKTLKEVHQHAEAIMALGKALPEKVSEDKKARVQGTVNNLTRLVDTLHHAADDGNQPRAGIELKKLDGVVRALAEQLK